ncbi:MAG: putative HicB family RNase H-like nuclease [Flavobacteriales bacterium]|jgi:predicted HicB family RNase H-like nuclease
MSSRSLYYKGYAARIEFSADNDHFIGRIAGINDQVEFYADNVSDLKLAFAVALEDYLEMCIRVGIHPSKHYSGKLMLRMQPEIHTAVAKAAQLSGKSINQWVSQALSKAAGI